MLTIKKIDNFVSLVNAVSKYKTSEYVGSFLREIDSKNDEFFAVFKKEGKTHIYSVISDNQVTLPDLSKLFYAAHLYQNEIYDFYGRITENFANHTLRLHTHPKDFFPLRKMGKSMIKERQDFIFTVVNGEGLVEVPVWPIHAWIIPPGRFRFTVIHAWIIPPGHFRFTVDGEDTLNLDTQMGWKHRGVEKYFYTEKDLNKLLDASQDIAWDSAVAYAWTFARLIEQSAGINISKTTGLNRILTLELERIYNHMWTIWALWNDVWQSFLLNWYLSIREDLLEVQREIFGSRTLKWVIKFWNSARKLEKKDFGKIEEILKKIEKRVSTLSYIEEYSSGVYDRFKDTWIVSLEATSLHSGLGLGAKASLLAMDERVYDKDYLENKIIVKPILWVQWDSFDRFRVRAQEIFQSISLIREVIEKLQEQTIRKKDLVSTQEIKLKDWLYTSFVEWHRWEIFQMMLVENGEISYFKAKDPSFVNWTLIEYAVLKNIIADFPICNKSYDLSYSGTDM